MRLVFLISLICFQIYTAGNPLVLSKQKIGEFPSGFQLIHVGPGNPGSAKVSEQQILNPITGSLENLRTLEIKGGNKSSNHYTLVLLKEPTYSNFNFSTRFKVIEGKGIRAAGMVFRMQENLEDYYLLAVKPVSKEAFWTVFKNNQAVKGFRFDEENFTSPKDGWQSVNLICKDNKISWTLNHREDFVVYKADKLPDYRDGLIGFWVRSDSRVLFVNPEVLTLKQHQQKKLSEFLRKISKENKRILSLQLAANNAKDKKPIVIASLNKKDINQHAHEVISEVLEKKENYFGHNNGISTVTVPVRDRNGNVIAAARMRLVNGSQNTKKDDLAYGTKISKLIQARILTQEPLFR